MAIKINFDTSHNTEEPTFILANRSGNKIGKLGNIESVNLKDGMNDKSEISFTVYKEVNNIETPYWNLIKDFKLVWCKEWDVWFEVKIKYIDSDKTYKDVSLVRLGQAELSEIKLFSIEINTENDIARDDYEPTVFYNPDKLNASLLNRVLNEKAPHYSIKHVDTSLKNIQRTFQFDNKSIKDCFDEIAEEIHCLVVYDSNSNVDGTISRTISFYDLESNCLDCGYRGEFTRVCPKCGSTNITEGYGEDTTICISKEDLGEEITLEVDTDSVKNCFRLEGGDDLMTATIRNCNPNGTQYLWLISDDIKEDMTDELVNQLNAYDNIYSYYQNEYKSNIAVSTIYYFNSLIDKYTVYNEELENDKINNSIIGYANLMQTYYKTIDLENFIDSELMPTWKLSDTTAEEQGKLLTTNKLSPVAVENISYISLSTANSSVLAMAKVIVDSRYDVKINASSINGTTWTGSFVITNYSDEEDIYTTSNVTIIISGDYETFVNQKIKRTLNKNKIDCAGGVVSLFDLENMSLNNFKEEIKKYCLNSLNSFADACQACIDILTEQGIADNKTWANQNPNLYQTLYVPYLDRLSALQEEIHTKEMEVNFISNKYNEENITDFQSIIEKERDKIQDALDFKKFLGEKLWLEFSSYRREDLYENSNYISDNLNNAELFKNALEFIETAQKEIYKLANFQHKITTKMKNLLVIKKFEPLIDYFEIGNWIRVKIDNTIYKLRLLEYNLNYDNIGDLSVTFSDVVNISNGVNAIQSVLNQAKSMATSYDSVKRQAGKGADSNSVLNNWTEKGLSLTATKIMTDADNQSHVFDEHGILLRRKNDILDSYDDEQLKIINSTLAITDDNWRTCKTAIGRFYYFDPIDKEMKSAYGINAEKVIGKLILGEGLGIYNASATMTFNEDGLRITNGTNIVSINPNDKSVLTITKGNTSLLSFDNNGNMTIEGEIKSQKGNIGGWDISDNGLIYKDSDTDFLALYSKSKSIMSQSGERRAILNSGKLVFNIGIDEYSSFTSSRWDGTEYYGTDVRSEVNSKFVAFGNRKNISDTKYTTTLLLNYGLNPNGNTQDVLIYGTSKFLNNMYFNNNVYLTSIANTENNINGIYCSGMFSTNYRLLVGNVDYGYKLSVDGATWISGNLYCNGGKVHGDSGSDMRIKRDFSSIKNIKNLYLGFKPKCYKYKEVYYKDKNIRDEDYHFGLIAQEVIKNFENNGLDISNYNIVEETKCFDGSNENGLILDGKKLMINYENLHALHIAFGQGLYNEFTNEINEIKKNIKKIENMLNK